MGDCKIKFVEVMKKKKYEVIISSEAEKELNDSKEYYNKEKENLGNEFVNAIDSTIQRIVENPEQFSKTRNQIRKAVVNRFPFNIFFAVQDLIINILIA